MTIETVELFAGIGGFRLACDKLGIKTIWANDIDTNATIITRILNNGSDSFYMR